MRNLLQLESKNRFNLHIHRGVSFETSRNQYKIDGNKSNLQIHTWNINQSIGWDCKIDWNFKILLTIFYLAIVRKFNTGSKQPFRARAGNTIQRMEWNTLHMYIWAKSWRLCVLASLPTSGPTLRDIQIEQWSINPRALTTCTASLQPVCIFELGIGVFLSSIVENLVINPPLVSCCSPGPLINYEWRQ